MGSGYSTPEEAIVVYRGTVRGTVRFSESDGEVTIRVNLKGLAPGAHGLHIHECGDLSDGCASACAHYNPKGTLHGGLHDLESHAGDLGNILADEQRTCQMEFKTRKFTIQEILGRSLIVHADPDDLGVNNTELSRTTGDSGERIACEVIGIAKTKVQVQVQVQGLTG